MNRTPLPRTPAAAVRAVRNHLGGHGFDQRRAGISARVVQGVLSVGVYRPAFADTEERKRLDTALREFTTHRVVALDFHEGHMFDRYTFDRETTNP